ncbi:MAG: ABC transporter permease [Deferribacteraceae bacterium]|jgi:putative ABC transport system permease protein|nr:ABC transporter permease [Deferribacteraceae bacterium]
MNIMQVAGKNLRRRKVRTAFTIIGIALSSWVLVTLLGFNKGYEASLNKDIDDMGFQIVLTAKGCPYEAATLMLKGGTGLRYMEEDVVKSVYEAGEVDEVTPMLMHAEFDPNKGENGGTTVYLGIDPATYPHMKPYNQFAQGDWFKSGEKEKEVVLGYEAAELEQREAGDTFLIGEDEYLVTGVLKRSGTQDDGMIFLPLSTAQSVFDKSGKITMLGIKLDKDADIPAFEEELYKLPDVQVVSMAQVKNTIMSLVTSAKVIVMSIVVIAFAIAMFGVLNTVLMSVFERYQEIGILKSMGAMPFDIFKMVLFETTILCGIGGIIGVSFAILISGASEFAIRYFIPFAPTGGLIQISTNLAVISVAAIIAIGLLGGIYPALRAAAIRPLSAIRSEE